MKFLMSERGDKGKERSARVHEERETRRTRRYLIFDEQWRRWILTRATEVNQGEVGSDDERRDGDATEAFHLEVLADRDAHGALWTK